MEKLQQYRLTYEVPPDSTIPHDTRVICSTEDGLLCEVVYRVIRKPGLVRKGIIVTDYAQYPITRREYDALMRGSAIV